MTSPYAAVHRTLAIIAITAPIAAAVVVFVFIRPTLLPGLGFWDTGEFQTVGPVLGTAHPPGFPAYVVLGWLASVVLQPFGEPAFRMNLLSALLVAATAGTIVILVQVLSGRTAVAIVAGMAFALTPLAWRIATRADPHALHVLLVALVLVALVAWERDRVAGSGDRWLLVASALFGVSLANHTLTLLLVPGIGLYVVAVDRGVLRRRRLVAMCAALILGTATLLYLELPLRAGPFRAPLVYARPDTIDGFAYVVLGQQFVGSFVDPFGDLGPKLMTLVDLTATQFGVLAPLLPAAFVATVLRRPRYALLTGTSAFVTCFFAASYVNADIERYYLGPLLMAWTWLAVLAAAFVDLTGAALAGRTSQFASRALQAVVAVVLAAIVLTPTVSQLTPRALLLDSSQDHAARTWVEEVVETLPPDAVVVSWWSFSTPLWYVQRVERRRPDITIVDDRTRLDEELGEVEDVIAAHLGHEPVYLVRREQNEMDRIRARFRIASVDAASGSLYRVTGPAAATP
jgi:hypothetical protein